MRPGIIIVIVIIIAAILFMISVYHLSTSGMVTDDKTVKIGVLAPLSGKFAPCGDDMKTGLNLALDEINANPNNKKIKLIYEDTQFNPAVGVSAARKLISHDNVKIIVGACSSSVTLAVASVAEENKVILLTPASIAPKISEAGDYIFRIQVLATDETKVAADFIRNRLNETRIAVLYINNDWGVSAKNSMAHEFKELGGEVVLDETWDLNNNDFRTILLKIKEVGVKIIYIPATPIDTANIIKQTHELGMNVNFVGANPQEKEDILNSLGLEAEGFIVTSLVPSEKEMNIVQKSFLAKFREKHLNKIINTQIVTSYDTLSLLSIAVNICDEDTECIKNWLYNITNFDGISGSFSIDKNGDARYQNINVKIVRNGVFTDFD